jgi:hypothetical protein
MALSQKYLKRLTKRRPEAEADPISLRPNLRRPGPPNCTGGAVARPARRASWCDDVEWLKQNFPEEFGEPAFEGRSERTSSITERSSAQPSSGNTNSEPSRAL